MDNISEALKISGGLLLTILLLGVIVLVYRSITTIPKAEEETLYAEEKATFNNEYIAYDKKIMLGTDVISVINKAIDNNSKYNFSDSQEKEYFINVRFKLKTPVEKVVYEYKKDETGRNVKTRIDRECKVIFGKVNTYVYLFDPKTGVINNNLKEFMKIGTTYSNDSNSEAIEEKQPNGNVKVTYTGYTDFKRKSFTCRKVEYNKNNGRISALVFDEIQQDESTY